MRCPVCGKDHDVALRLSGFIDVVACEAVPEGIGGFFVRSDVGARGRRTDTMNDDTVTPAPQNLPPGTPPPNEPLAPQPSAPADDDDGDLPAPVGDAPSE